MKALGHWISDNGTVTKCVSETIKSMHASFFASFHPSLVKSSFKTRTRFLEGSVKSVLSFRWSRWPFKVTTAQTLDSLQRRFVSLLFPVVRKNGDTPDSRRARQSRNSSLLQNELGRWSDGWAGSVLGWDAHVRREHDTKSWNHVVTQWRPASFIDRCRALASSQGESRTRTRTYRGGKCTSWEQGLTDARLWMQR